MNREQIKIMAKHINMTKEAARMAELVIIDGLTGYAAENLVYGKTTATASRAIKRIKKEFNYIQKMEEISK